MNDIKLFDYQQDMLGRVQEAFRKHQSVMAQMPTGTGKTYLLAAVVKGEGLRFGDRMESRRGSKKQCPTAEGYGYPCVWIVAHRTELVAQIEETLARFGLPTSPNEDSSSSSTCSSPSYPHPSLIRVMSIQWLTLHYGEMTERPSLIVVDEAHHAVACTYAEVLRAYPKAKILGLTATPYRMNGRGFGDLFDVLLTSWSVERFIAEGRLSLYDYYSIKPDSEDQQLVDSLKKRGADGDYQPKEMGEVMDVRPSLERLCMTVKRYAPNKKGIVYAFSIAHAEHIAGFYRENGINAVAISSKTPSRLRKEILERFKKSSFSSANQTDGKPNGMKESSLPIQVLVSVDLFSEGFDCPDVEFIQMARPTLSLSKYLQMAGRGLRVAKGKDYCVMLDNVGLYRRFGLPSADRDWQRMFAGKDDVAHGLQEACMRIIGNICCMTGTTVEGGEMTKIIGHDRQLQAISRSYGFKVTGDGNGRKGIADKDGRSIVECKYADIELTDDGFAHCRKTKSDKTGKWADLRNGLLFDKRPQSITLLDIDFCTEDGKRLYPRIRSKFIDDKTYLSIKTLMLQVGSGLNWKRRFIPWDNTGKVYMYKGGVNDLRLYCDDNGHYAAQENIGSPLADIKTQEQMDEMCHRCAERHEQDQKTRRMLEETAARLRLDGVSSEQQKHWITAGDGMAYARSSLDGKESWVDLIAMRIYPEKPTRLFNMGFVKILQSGDWCYVRNIPGLRNKPLKKWEIVADNNICVIGNEFLFLKQEPRLWYKVFKRTDDFSYFVVKEHEANYKNYIGIPDITITQFGNDGLKMERNGVPYTPYFQPELKPQRSKPRNTRT